MPTVPKIERSVGLTPLSGVHIPQPPGGAFEGMSRTQTAAARVYEDELARIDETRLNEERRVFFDEFEYPNVYDPERGAISLRGRDAIGIGKKIEEEFDRFISMRTQGLSTERQRQAYRQWGGTRKRSLLQWAARHEATQTEAYIDSEFTSGIETAKERGSVDPANALLEAAYIRSEISKRAYDRGLGEDYIRQETQKHITDLHIRMIGNMLVAGQSEGARAYYNSNEKSIDPDVRREILPKIRELEVRERAQKETDAVTEKKLSLKDALAKVRQINNVEVRDETIKRVKQFYEDMDKAEKADHDRAYMDAVNLMEENPGRNPRDVIPVDDYMKFTVTERNALDARYLKNKTNDDKAWLEFIGLPQEEMAELSQRDFETKYWTKFDDGHKGRAVTFWREAREKRDRPAEFTTIITPARIAESTWASLGLGKPSDFPAEFARFEQEVQTRLNVFEATELGGKRKASQEEIKDIAGRVAAESIMVRADESYFRFPVTKPATEVSKGADIEEVIFKESPEPLEQYAVGKTYTDAQGRKAKYLGGNRWQLVQ